MKIAIARVFFASLTMLVAAMTAPAFSASASGSWTIAPGVNANQAHFEIRIDGPNKHESNDSDVDLGALGLSNAELQSPGQHVAFTLSRDAGSFDCDGWVSHGSGGGTVTFNPRPTFIGKMRALGYDDVTTDEQVTAAMIDLSSQYAESIVSAGYPHLPFHKLVAFRALRVDDAYIRSMREAFGNTTISAETMISLKALGVTGDYVAQLRSAGLIVSSPQNAISLKALHVDRNYIDGLASAGYSHLTSEQVVQLRALHIDNAFIEKVRSHGFSHPSIDELVRLKAMNVI